MKKTTAIILAFIMIIAVLASCGRRDQYRDPVGTETNAETTSPTTNAVTDQPDNPDETTGQDTESGTTPVNPGNPPSQEGTGNPYAGMSKDDLLTLYQQTSERATLSSDMVINTPYYYLFCRDTYGTGGKAYSKLTGKVVTLCKEVGCKHDDNCIYTGNIEECVIIGDRIYLGIQNNFAKLFRLYSFNFLLDDAKLIYEWGSDEAPGDFSAIGEKIYMVGQTLTSDGTVKYPLFVFDLHQKSYTPVMDDDSNVRTGNGIWDGYFYYSAADGSLWQYEIATAKQKCLLEASLLNSENGDMRFFAYGFAGQTHLCVMRQGILETPLLYYNLTSGEVITEESLLGEDKANLVWTSTAQYLLIKHNTPAFENDPHYTYYNDKVENWLVNYSGGEIWFRPDSNSELSLLVRMQTDGIPDAIRYVVATDGKALVVSYKTYKDFENVYNDYNKLTSGDSLRYAVIDLETGTVYK